MTPNETCELCRGPSDMHAEKYGHVLDAHECPPDISRANPCPLLQLSFESMTLEAAKKGLSRIWNAFGPPAWERRGEVIPFRQRGDR